MAATLPPTSSTAVVTVGCKLPHGIHMDFNTPGQPLRRVTLRGTNASRVIGGFGITKNVSKEYFEKWIKENKELPAVKNGLIFAMDKEASAKAKAKEMAKETNGFERLDPTKPPKGIKATTKVEDPNDDDDDDNDDDED